MRRIPPHPWSLSHAVLQALSVAPLEPSKPLYLSLADVSERFAKSSTALRRMCDDLSRSRLRSKPGT